MNEQTTMDPVCGMSVEPATATASGLHSRYEGRDYYFCGKGCKLASLASGHGTWPRITRPRCDVVFRPDPAATAGPTIVTRPPSAR